MIVIYEAEMNINDVHPSAPSSWESSYGYHGAASINNMIGFVVVYRGSNGINMDISLDKYCVQATRSELHCVMI